MVMTMVEWLPGLLVLRTGCRKRREREKGRGKKREKLRSQYSLRKGKNCSTKPVLAAGTEKGRNEVLEEAAALCATGTLQDWELGPETPLYSI